MYSTEIKFSTILFFVKKIINLINIVGNFVRNLNQIMKDNKKCNELNLSEFNSEKKNMNNNILLVWL